MLDVEILVTKYISKKCDHKFNVSSFDFDFFNEL